MLSSFRCFAADHLVIVEQVKKITDTLKREKISRNIQSSEEQMKEKTRALEQSKSDKRRLHTVGTQQSPAQHQNRL